MGSKDFDESSLGSNPFTEVLDIPVRRQLMRGQFVKDEVDDILLHNVVDLEMTPYSKIYIDAQRRKLALALPHNSKTMLLWALYEIKPGKDFVRIEKVRYLKENGIGSVNTYKTAVKGLIDAKILHYTHISGIFWVNPHFFFRGDRVSKYPKNVRITSDY